MDNDNILLMENDQVKELIAILKEIQTPTSQDLWEAILQVTKMEQRLTAALAEVEAMREGINKIQSQDMPFPPSAASRPTIENGNRETVNALAEVQKSFTSLKGQVIEGCRNVLQDFKEFGITALNGAAKYFCIKPAVSKLLEKIDTAIQASDNTVAKIEQISQEYHEAGMHLKNFTRAITGKEPIQEVKKRGKLATTLQTPYLVELSCLHDIRKAAEHVLSKLEQLEQAAEKKPSVLEAIRDHKESISVRQQGRDRNLQEQQKSDAMETPAL